MVPCRFSPCLCERGRADMEGGGGLETKLNTQETHELSYGLSNFNDIVCEKEGI